jgi:protoheme IX farnesyltransferase
LKNSPKDYLALTKPRLTLSAVATALMGFVLASQGSVDWVTGAHALLGAALLGGGVNALNQLIERAEDARMKRTESRPLPAGRLSPRAALAFGIALTLYGIAHLFIFTTQTAGILGVAAAASYVLIYTPLKKMTVWNTAAGAVPGALPTIIGWTAAGGRLDAGAAALFAFLFLWQLPHFFAIAWVYREDYERGGMKMISVTDGEGRKTAWLTVFFSLLLLPVSLVPSFIGLTGALYFYVAAVAGVALSAFAAYLMYYRFARAKRFVTASILYLLVIISFMMIDKA